MACHCLREDKRSAEIPPCPPLLKGGGGDFSGSPRIPHNDKFLLTFTIRNVYTIMKRMLPVNRNYCRDLEEIENDKKK
jgi:hypothetical protein